MMLEKSGVNYTVNTDTVEMERLGIASVPALLVDDKLYTYNEAMEWAVTHGKKAK